MNGVERAALDLFAAEIERASAGRIRFMIGRGKIERVGHAVLWIERIGIGAVRVDFLLQEFSHGSPSSD